MSSKYRAQGASYAVHVDHIQLVDRKKSDISDM